MNKVLSGLLVVTALSLIFAACLNPSFEGADSAILSRAIALNDADKAAAAPLTPAVSARTNASGKDISSNGQDSGIPGVFFFWDPKQKDNGYLKVEASLFDVYENFVLTTKEANKYWDFLIEPQAGQIVTGDLYYVFFIEKQEKNINGVYLFGFEKRDLGAAPIDSEALYAKMDALYGDIHDFSSTSRANKMRALIMEIALKAKSRNPNFNIIPQDTTSLAYNNGATNQGLDLDFLKLIDGWGIENTSTYSTFTTLRNQGGLKMTTATANATSTAAVTTAVATAQAAGSLYFPRLGTGAYVAAGYPFYATNGDYMLVEDPVAAGLGDTINNGNVYSLRDAKNYLYMINPNRYVGWPEWDERWLTATGNRRINISDSSNMAYAVPCEGGPMNISAIRNAPATSPLYAPDNQWDWWWRALGRNVNDGRKWLIEDLAASNWDVIYIDPHYGDYYPLTPAEVNRLKYKADGGRRQVIAYLSIGTAEAWRWFAGGSSIFWNDDDEEWVFATGTISGGTYRPNPSPDVAKWAVFSAYSGQYSDEAAIIWWHPEWRDIMVRGGCTLYENPYYEHSFFAPGRSSIDRIIDQGFDGVYLDNLSRYSINNYTAVGNYDAANPTYFWD